MPEKVDLSLRLKKLFNDTKLACFGRYALEVPKEAELIFGDASFPSPIIFIDKPEMTIAEMAKVDIDEIFNNSKSAEVMRNAAGPIENSWQIHYFEGGSEKKYGLKIFKTYRAIDNKIFILSNAVRKGETELDALARDKLRIMNLRLRNADEVTTDPGYCIEGGFVRSDYYSGQEMVSAGIQIQEFPDVTFSIRSNKNAYADYPKEEFEHMKRKELTLLNRIKGAQELQGSLYPARTVLREGKRAVQHWQGEESLIRRADGTHDFEWSFIGTPKDVANPSVYEVTMFTKVAYNTVGAANKASLTDDEAVALWDKLLSGLKFRVKVPGAPEGSYYFLPGAKTDGGAKP